MTDAATGPAELPTTRIEKEEIQKRCKNVIVSLLRRMPALGLQRT